MQCLMCGKEKESRSFYDLIDDGDPICHECRKEWLHKPAHRMFEGYRWDSDYIYNEAFSNCLIQYKELYDEALKDVFLYKIKNKLKRRYHNYQICLLPSNQRLVEQRGFSHLKEMFSCLNKECIEPWMKLDDVEQKTLTYSERRTIEQRIVLKENTLPHKLVLCDDVLTTGSTMKAVLNSLKDGSYDIRIYTLSRVENKHNKGIYR